jgi:hypothetical protein
MGPWATVQAAMFHQTPGSGLSARAAFAAHTRGGWRALRPSAPHHDHHDRAGHNHGHNDDAAANRAAQGVPADETGVLTTGSPATYAVWAAEDLVVQAPDSRVAAWSTDERSGVPGLPDLSPGRELPTCLRTSVRGRIVFDTLA